jgi:hypothetical protein
MKQKHYDYALGYISSMGQWTALRVALGNLFRGTLTAIALSAGDQGWAISVRSTIKLSALEVCQLQGFFMGYVAGAAA